MLNLKSLVFWKSLYASCSIAITASRKNNNQHLFGGAPRPSVHLPGKGHVMNLVASGRNHPACTLCIAYPSLFAVRTAWALP